MAVLSPTVAQKRLARSLRMLRLDAGFTIEQAADRLELSPSTISRMETAQVGVKRRDVRELLDLYEVTGAQREHLLRLAGESRQHAWWHEFKDLPNLPLASLEAGAASIWQYSALLIPGLLQTEEYAREVLRQIRLDATPDAVERRLRLRMKRQALLTDQNAPQFWVVLDEAVLRRCVGGRQIMQRQLQRLIDASALRSVTLQVLPFASGGHAAMDGEFTLLNYPEPADPDVVFIENTGGDVYLEDPDVTRRYTSIFDHLRATALDPTESVRTLVTVKDELQDPERS